MATKPLRPCNHQGCKMLTRERWCPQHRPKYQRRESQAWHRMYGLDIWQRLRAEQLLRESWCRECAQVGHRVRATVVDHIVPHRGNMTLFTDPANLQSLCKRCHDRKTMRERSERRG